jgi:regulator of nucleoside diphosphate kinase
MHRNEQRDYMPVVRTIDKVFAGMFGAPWILSSAAQSHPRLRTLAGDAHFVHNGSGTTCTDMAIGVPLRGASGEPKYLDRTTGLIMNAKPAILLSARDVERLESLLATVRNDTSPHKAALEAELARADIVEPENMPPSVVTMNSTVRFSTTSSAEVFCKTLVYPKDMNGEPDRISVLAPVGSALLGLSSGDQITWPRPDGGVMQVKIVEVVYQPERAGQWHR